MEFLCFHSSQIYYFSAPCFSWRGIPCAPKRKECSLARNNEVMHAPWVDKLKDDFWETLDLAVALPLSKKRPAPFNSMNTQFISSCSCLIYKFSLVVVTIIMFPVFLSADMACQTFMRRWNENTTVVIRYNSDNRDVSSLK